MTVINGKPHRLRFRRSGALWLAAVLMVVFVVPFSGSVFAELDGFTRSVLTPIAALALIVPVLIAVWSLRSGVDVTPQGLRIKALFGAKTYRWSAIRGFDTRGRTVYALLDSDRFLPLPAVRAIDLPQLIEAGGGELAETDRQDDPDETAVAESQQP